MRGLKLALALGSVLALSAPMAACSMFSRDNKKGDDMIRDVPHRTRANPSVLRHRVLILPFIDEKASRPQRVLLAARDTVVRTLQRTGRFVIIKNEDFSEDLDKYITQEREYDIGTLAKKAGSMGISAVIDGKILEIKARRVGDQVGVFRKVRARVDSTVRIRVANSKNGRIIMEDTRSGTRETKTTRVAEYSFSDRYLEEDPTLVRNSVQSAFYGAIVPIIKSIEKIAWEGRVALVSGERVFINAGRLSGIQVGDILKIMDEGEEIYDPETGAFLGRAPGRMKGTVEVVSYFGQDGSITILHSGSGFKENDRVELY